jgi:hypothetical protein
MDRKNNIVMFNVNEQEGNIKDDIATKERETVIDIAHQIGVNIDVSDIINLKRVGKKTKLERFMVKRLLYQDLYFCHLLVFSLLPFSKQSPFLAHLVSCHDLCQSSYSNQIRLL